jgi:uncharacterized membrane protein YphA (DoxX/SURF4 family)
MHLKSNLRTIVIQGICFLYILLFAYAATSKLLDYENFQVEISQSPVLTAFTGIIAPGILILEFGLALLLAIPKFRLAALLASFTLMVIFSSYIVIILNYSSYIPCSCGGVLEEMGWTQHLIFNLCFVALAAIGALLLIDHRKMGLLYFPLCMLTLAAAGIITVTALYIFSEDMVHSRNNFIRTFRGNPVMKTASLNLTSKSYYFAGESNGKVYLGNFNATSSVTILDSTLIDKKLKYITLADTTARFRNVRLRVTDTSFYLLDGLGPSIYTGRISNWIAYKKMQGIQLYSLAVPVDSNSVIFRAPTVAYGNLLGKFDFKDQPNVKYQNKILERQIDGVFDTDGTMNYSPETQKFVYTYFYRNQYIVTDNNLSLITRGNTIDTTTKAKIKIAYLVNTKVKKFAAPPQSVNIQTAVKRNLLFVHSGLRGKYDTAAMWKDASVIDVYDYTNKNYIMSFYVYKVNGKPMNSFIVTDKYLFALFNNQIVSYKLGKPLKRYYK